MVWGIWIIVVVIVIALIDKRLLLLGTIVFGIGSWSKMVEKETF